MKAKGVSDEELNEWYFQVEMRTLAVVLKVALTAGYFVLLGPAVLKWCKLTLERVMSLY